MGLTRAGPQSQTVYSADLTTNGLSQYLPTDGGQNNHVPTTETAKQNDDNTLDRDLRADGAFNRDGAETAHYPTRTDNDIILTDARNASTQPAAALKDKHADSRLAMQASDSEPAVALSSDLAVSLLNVTKEENSAARADTSLTFSYSDEDTDDNIDGLLMGTEENLTNGTLNKKHYSETRQTHSNSHSIKLSRDPKLQHPACAQIHTGLEELDQQPPFDASKYLSALGWRRLELEYVTVCLRGGGGEWRLRSSEKAMIVQVCARQIGACSPICLIHCPTTGAEDDGYARTNNLDADAVLKGNSEDASNIDSHHQKTAPLNDPLADFRSYSTRHAKLTNGAALMTYTIHPLARRALATTQR